MSFTEPHLHNKNSDVREAAVKVVVELCIAVGDDMVSPFLTQVRTQLLDIIKDKISEARGNAPRAKLRKRPGTFKIFITKVNKLIIL
jgi:hypothetical protein